MSSPVRDKAVAFGPDRSAIGILTAPSGSQGKDAPHVILINSGIIHRVGASRLYVSLAREFAHHGFPTLRFDLSGIGDSAPRKESLSLSDTVKADIDDAISFLEQTRQANRFIVMGLCSGAHDAFETALRRPDVVGLALLDIPGPFRNWQQVACHYGKRLLRLDSWWSTIRGRNTVYRRAWNRVVGADRLPDTGDSAGIRQGYSRDTMQDHFSALIGRSVPVHLVFTAGMENNYNHRSQFREVFPSVSANPLVSYQYFPKADHIFSRAMERRALSDSLTHWLSETEFPAMVIDQTVPEKR